VLPKTHFRSFTQVMRKVGASLRGDLPSEVLFCFPALRFDVFSPYRDGRYCSAPKPGKEKQKSYDYRSAILMVHRFRSFLSVFVQVLRKIWREVTRKMAAHFEALPPSPSDAIAAKTAGFSSALVRRSCDTLAKPKDRSHARQARASFLLRKFFRTLRPNYSDEIAQFVFDVAGHSDGMGNLLTQ
jgi:hypothetical protein